MSGYVLILDETSTTDSQHYFMTQEHTQEEQLDSWRRTFSFYSIALQSICVH